MLDLCFHVMRQFQKAGGQLLVTRSSIILACSVMVALWLAAGALCCRMCSFRMSTSSRDMDHDGLAVFCGL